MLMLGVATYDRMRLFMAKEGVPLWMYDNSNKIRNKMHNELNDNTNLSPFFLYLNLCKAGSFLCSKDTVHFHNTILFYPPSS